MIHCRIYVLNRVESLALCVRILALVEVRYDALVALFDDWGVVEHECLALGGQVKAALAHIIGVLLR